MFLSGRVHSFLFEDTANSLYIMRMVLDPPDGGDIETVARHATALKLGETITVKGNVPGAALKIGSWFGFEGHWVTHPKYGRQLSITSAPLKPPKGWTTESASKALVANDVGAQIVELLVFAHNEDLPNVLNDKARLIATPGLDEFTALFVQARWLKIQAYFKGLDFLLDLKLPPALIRKVWSTFGDDAQEVLGSNPWALVRVEGISFTQADEVATRMGLPISAPGRLQAAVLSVAKTQRMMGHLYLSTGQMFAEVKALLPDVTPQQVGEALAQCHKEKTLVVERGVRKGVTAIYEPWNAQIEKDAADALLARLKNAAYSDTGLDTARYIKALSNMGKATAAVAQEEGVLLRDVAQAAVAEWQTMAHFTLSEKQKQGVINALTEPVSILTGLPGTGKSSSLQAAVKILQEAGIQYLLTSPTAIAAKNLANKTGSIAYTVHRGFMAMGGGEEKREAGYTGVMGESTRATYVDQEGQWGYGPAAPHPAEVVFVDESSMLDQHLLYRLMICTGPQTRFVFVGDAAQLPSVGPGNVLRDLINSMRFAVVNLTEIYRQKDTSAIIFAAHSIYKGEMPECAPPSDFSLVPVQNEEQAQAIILKMASKLFMKRANFQILSPRHSGLVGVTNLNSKLRDLLNPAGAGLAEVRVGNDVIREDDRIMVIRNDYKRGIVNGDVGKVIRIDNREKIIELKIFGEQVLQVEVPLKDAGTTIRLAYCCTVHKAQGLEYDIIVMPVVESFKHQLQRNLLYTAVTRARQKVFLVGSYSALAIAIGNDKEDQRNTLLRDRLMGEVHFAPPLKITTN